MIRLGIFVCVVSSLYVIGQKEQLAAIEPQPAGVPMTLTLEGTRIAAPERPGAAWRSDIAIQDVASAPAGFNPAATALINPVRLAVSASEN